MEDLTKDLQTVLEKIENIQDRLASLADALFVRKLLDELEQSAIAQPERADVIRKNMEFIRENRQHMGWLDRLVEADYCCEDCSPYWQSLLSRAEYDDFIGFCRAEIETKQKRERGS